MIRTICEYVISKIPRPATNAGSYLDGILISGDVPHQQQPEHCCRQRTEEKPIWLMMVVRRTDSVISCTMYSKPKANTMKSTHTRRAIVIQLVFS